MKFTVFGGRGFVGGHLVKALLDQGHDVEVPHRNYIPQAENLGMIVYAAGVTGDFQSRPFDTMRGHVGLVGEILERTTFESFTYLSSTRVYGPGETNESADISVNAEKRDHLYNLSKLAGESLCLSSGRGKIKVARLSNVYGADLEAPNFLSGIMQAAKAGRIDVRTSPASAKDYVFIDDVVNLLVEISTREGSGIYNVASGENVTNEQVTTRLQELSGCSVCYEPAAPTLINTPISVERIRREFGFQAVKLLDALPALMKL